ncbi:MAG TPA: LuxR C-terminal-related transcriptional regulator [Vicinamibacterales bacterium]|nr:LuxR C-terminal-related transcriptional regulator [Vicinamibacterales bacterium]
MRVILVGSLHDRERLRSQLDGSMQVAGEFATLSAARASGLDVDALLVAPEHDVDADLPSDDDGDESGGGEPLTPREVQVLELLAEGLPNKTIAARLGISDQTVKFHIASLSGKLGAANRTDAVRRGVRRGLVTL